ncbi:MAG: nuclear transport factor 2 family protein [Actinomycetota bacterium]
MCTPQTTDDEAVVRAYCDAWLAGDVMAVLAMYHDDLTLMWPGRHPLAGTYQGVSTAVEALLALDAATNRVPVEVIDVLGGAHGAVAIVRERWSRGDHDSIEVQRALHYTVRDGRLHTCRVFEFDQPSIDDWLAAAETPFRR